MLWDWILREGWLLPVWWALVTIAGLTVFPLCIRLFNGLPDNGYTLARAIGMLLIAFVYWLLGSYGFIDNSVGGMVLAWLIVLVISLIAYFRLVDAFSWRDYWRENRTIIIVGEILFIVLFASMMVYRAYQNDTSSTEKPMELAFISGIMRSESFPPNDPWLAGFSISYYHFGYIMAAMLSMLSGVTSAVGFSMTIALWFGITGLNIFGVMANLVRSRMSDGKKLMARLNFPAITTGILAVVFVLILGNLQTPLIELPYQSRSMPAEYFNFWGTQERTVDQAALNQSFQENSIFTVTTPFDSQGWSSWWWFRASRVLTDYELNGTQSTHAQPIDEFPAFSFVLSDVHPHVLALPFVVLALGLALNITLMSREPNRYEIVLYGLVIGGLVFLNTWDGPIYLMALVGAEALRRIRARGRLYIEDWIGLFVFGGQLLIIAIVAYLPFLIGFRSQAAGIVPNLVYPTLFRRLFIMLGSQLVLAYALLAIETWRAHRHGRFNWKLAIIVPSVVLLVLIALVLLLIIASSFIPSIASTVNNFLARNGGWSEVLPALMQRRVTYGLTTLAMLTGIGMVVGRLFPPVDYERNESAYDGRTGFALLLVGIGLSLILIPEFIYLRDNFSVRINTIFKFYYQAWITLSMAGAYGVYTILQNDADEAPMPIFRYLFGGALAVILLLGAIYPTFAFYTRAWRDSGHAYTENPVLTIDGSSKMTLSTDDYEAVMCLADLVPDDNAIVVEAERDAYNPRYGRVGSITGIPILLGWEGHEGQWRGATFYETVGTRPADIEELYTDLRWDIAQEILARYEIDYVFFGDTERQQYGSVSEDKFRENLAVVCEFGGSRVYRVTPNDLP